MTHAPRPVIRTTDALAEVCAELRTADFVALDTEFMRDATYWPKLCLIQLAGGEIEAVVDPLADGLDLAPLYALLADTDVLKVLHAARQDVEIFHHFGGVIPEPLFDTQIGAMALGYGDSIAYDALVAKLLKLSIDKSSRFTDWSRRPLGDKQLAYALADVTHLRDLYPKMRARLERKDRLDWIAAEHAVLTDPATYDLSPEIAWRRLKLRKTSPGYLAALKAAAQWRETEAQSRDLPRSRIMKDDTLYDIALQQPQSADALARLRGAPRGFERSRGGQSLIIALQTALADPEIHAPKVARPEPTPPGIGPIVDFLKVLLKLKAEENEVAPRLIATVSDLEKIAADDAADTPALSGWRRELFGQTALELKHGRIALKLENGRVVAVDLDGGDG
ncbi:MAG: ribonuclease D [Maricaulaceae bacterium]